MSPHTYQNGCYQKKQEITSVGEDVEKRQHLCTAGGNVNWYIHYGKQYGSSLKCYRPLLPYGPAILFLYIYLKKMKTLIWKDICILIFTAALFTIAKTWKQLKCPLIDEQKDVR